MKQIRTFLAGLTILGAIAAGTPALGAELPALPAGLSAPVKPTSIPAFDLPTTAGKPLRSESLRGQVLVVRFWASW